jgi:hypothetical protein
MATTRVAVAPMKVAQVLKPGGEFEIVEREIPKPGVGHVHQGAGLWYLAQ